MKSDASEKQARVMLDAEEASLRADLLAVLPSAARDGGQLFMNSTNSREPVAWSHGDADVLFASANRCVRLRESLGLEGEGEVAGHFLAACREASSGDPHRRGPRKLAEWLLEKLKT
jgi:hypothetical protein